MRTIRCKGIPAAYYKGVRYILDNGVMKFIHGTRVQQGEACALDITLSDDNTCNWAPLKMGASAEYMNNFLSPDKGDFTYTYGNRIRSYFGRDQIDDVVKRITADKYTRQAIIQIWDASHDNDIEDCPCLQHIQFYFNDKDEFTMKVLFRSNDWYGALYQNMIGLNKLFKYISDKLNVKPVKYIHEANCPHIYWHQIEDARVKIYG